MGLLANWWKTTRKVGTDPEGFFRIAEKYEGISFPMKYFSISSAVLAILYTFFWFIYSLVSNGFSISILTGVFIQFLIAMVGFIGGNLFFMALAHVFLFLMGGKNWKETFKIIAYATGPAALIGLIPLLNLYILFIHFKGIKTVHKVSTIKAILTLIFAMIISTVLPLITLIAVMGGAIAAIFL